MKTKLTLFTALLITCLSFAQNGFNYKAIIKDGLGNVVSMQNITLQFTIYEGVANVYQETHPLTTDLNGVVITNIGEGTTTDDFSSVNWGNNDLYLKVEVDINGGSGFEDMGTTQFKSVPFAKVSVKATGMQISDLTDVDGTPSNGQVLKFDGTNWKPGTDEGASGSTLWTENGDDIYYSEGNVIIGDAYDVGKLNVNISNLPTTDEFPYTISVKNMYSGDADAVGIMNRVDGTGTGNKIGMFSTITNGNGPKEGFRSHITQSAASTTSLSNGFFSYLANNSSNLSFGFRSSTTGTGSGTNYGIYTTGEDVNYFSGKVGIGTSNPIKMFHVKTSDQATARFESTGTRNYLEFFSNNQYQGYLGLNSGVRDMDFGTGFGNSTGKLNLVTGAVPKLTVAAGGNVGIGTTSPAAKLDIAGGQWDLINNEGDFRIGNNTYRLKMGMSLDGGGAGRAHIRAQGGINEIVLGAGTAEALKIKENAIVINGEVNRASTGEANLIPVAYGTVNGFTGLIANGTGNITSNQDGIGRYVILINSETTISDYTAIVTRFNSVPGFIGVTNLGSNIRVSTWDQYGDPINCSFTFVAYKK